MSDLMRRYHELTGCNCSHGPDEHASWCKVSGDLDSVITAEQVIAALSMPFSPGPWFPWELPRSADMSDDLADWIDSRANDTFLHGDYWGRIVRYSDSVDGRVWFEKP